MVLTHLVYDHHQEVGFPDTLINVHGETSNHDRPHTRTGAHIQYPHVHPRACRATNAGPGGLGLP